MSFDIADLEGRFWHDLGDVASEAEAALHSKIASAVEAAAKELIPLLPEGGAVEAVLSKLDEVAAVVHAAATPEAPEAAPAGTEPVAEATPAAEAPAPVEDAPAPEATAGQGRPQ